MWACCAFRRGVKSSWHWLCPGHVQTQLVVCRLTRTHPYSTQKAVKARRDSHWYKPSHTCTDGQDAQGAGVGSVASCVS